MIKKWSLLKTLLSILTWLLFLWYGGATTIFSPGDIFIITANANPDMIEFVSRVDMNSWTIIRFSDDSRTSTWTWRATEWYITFTSNTNIPKGTIIWMSWLHTTPQTVFPTWFGTITKNNSFDLSTAGESILVYQGTPYNQISPTFLYWLGFGSWTIWINSWIAEANTSYLPSNINLWTTAILITSGANVQYNCSNTALLDASFTTAINNQNNWNKGTSWFPFPPSTCVFDFTQPTLSIDLWSWQADFTSGSNIKFKVTSSEPLNTGSFTCSDLVFWWDLSGSTTCSSITQIAPFNNTAFEVSLTVSPGMSWYGDIDMNILSWTVSDVAGNSNTVSTVINNYIIVDILAPVIVLNGSTSLTLTQWTAFSDSGASWTDSVDGSGVVALPTSWSVNINIPWIYTLEYTYTDSAGNNGNIVTRTVTVQAISSATGTISTWSSWWWGGWYILQKDNCPDWDHSPTYYDGVCKWDNEPVDEQTFNPSIWSTCFKPLNKKTIDQGIQVSEAFKTAHQILYSYQLTKRQGTRDYRPFDYLTREEAARFMVEFAQNVLCRKPTRSYNNNFSDINNANPTLTKFIRESYNYGIFNGNSDGTFRPNDRITNDELSAIMVRLVTNSMLDEPEWDRAAQYRSTLSQYAQISILNNEGRWNIAEVIYDLYRNNTYILNKNGYIIQ